DTKEKKREKKSNK
ncbi:unnamed protein product, partial [Rotaria socialis]